MKNLSKRDGIVPGMQEEGSIQQKAVVVGEWQYWWSLRRQETFYEN